MSLIKHEGNELIDRMEKETNNLQKEAKTYLDAMRGKLRDLECYGLS